MQGLHYIIQILLLAQTIYHGGSEFRRRALPAQILS